MAKKSENNSLITLKKEAIYAYAVLFSLNFLLYSIQPSLSDYLMPLILVTFPLILSGNINIRFSIRHMGLGLIISLAILIPFSLVLMSLGKSFTFPVLYLFPFQLFGVALPEEAFFRGFLQNSLGNNGRGIVIVSLLFSIAHLPKVLFNGDWLAFLTFFPSLIMGWLYMKTSNILPSIIFHFFANIVFIGFKGLN